MNTLEQIEQISHEYKVLNFKSDFPDLGIVRLDFLLISLLTIYLYTVIAMRLQVAKSDMQTTTIRTGCLTCKKRGSTHQNRHFTQHHLYHLYKGCQDSSRQPMRALELESEYITSESWPGPVTKLCQDQTYITNNFIKVLDGFG